MPRKKLLNPIDQRFVLLQDSTRFTDCKNCPLLVERNNSGIVPPELIEGSTHKVLIVGEAPGRQERKKHRPFIGPAGQVLRTAMERIEAVLGMEVSWVVANVIQCFPRTADNPDRFRIPTVNEARCCQGSLLHLLEQYRPPLMFLLGQVPQFYVQRIRPSSKHWPARTFPLYHPSYILRRGGINSPTGQQWLTTFIHNLETANKDGLLVP